MRSNSPLQRPFVRDFVLLANRIPGESIVSGIPEEFAYLAEEFLSE